MDAAGEQSAIKGLEFLVNEPSSPFNDRDGITAFVLLDSMPPVRDWYGTYLWSRDSGKFIFKPGGNGIDIYFQSDTAGENDLKMIVQGIGCHPFFTKPCFPDLFEAIMQENNDDILEIRYRAEFSGELPSGITLELVGKSFRGHFESSRTREGNTGTVSTSFEFSARGSAIMKGTIFYQVGYNGDQVFLRTAEPDFRLFDIHIKGILDYTKVDPTSEDYIGSFNRASHIEFTEQGSGRSIGKFGIGTDETGELLEWVILPGNGPTISLYDHVLVFRKVMDYKYPNRI
jgi:hypothetical protein